MTDIVPAGWTEWSMGDVMAEFYDGPHATPPASETGAIYLGIKNITDDGRLDLSQVRRIAEADYATWTKRVEPRAGDLVFTYEATLHRYAVLPSGFRGTLGRRVALIRPRSDRVATRYLHYVFLSPQWRRTIEQRVNIGSTVDRIPLIDFPQYPIVLPPLEYQQQAVHVLGAIDGLVEGNRRRVEILEEMARLLYREWFVHFRFPGHEDIKFVDSNLGPIPEGWEVRPFLDLAGFVNGFAFKPTHWLAEGLPIIKIKELKNGVAADTPRYHGEGIDKKYFIDNGSVLFSWSADLKAYVWAHGPALLNQHLFDVRPHEISRLFIFHALNEKMDEFQARAQGTTMKHIKRSALREVRVALPPVELRDEFESMARPMLDLQLKLSAQTQALREVKALLLPRLVSGELDVSKLDLGLAAV